MFVFVQRIHEYKVLSTGWLMLECYSFVVIQRQTLNILGVIHVNTGFLVLWACADHLVQRYFALKKMTPEEKKKVNRRVVFFAGKAAPACESTFAISWQSRTNYRTSRLHCQAGMDHDHPGFYFPADTPPSRRSASSSTSRA